MPSIEEIVADPAKWGLGETEWSSTRHCPSCGSTSLRVHSDDPMTDGWCTTECAGCGRELRVDRLDGPPWEDREWAASGEH